MNTSKLTTKFALLLGFVALICASISTGIYFLTKSKIEQVIAKQQQELLLQVIPQQYFDNDLLNNCYQPTHQQINQICVGEKNQQKSVYAIQATAPDGYSGDIRLLIGMTAKGEILGVRVLEHKETPGLGDKIETRISDWILSFNHKSISQDNLNQWAVKKDGGQFDQFAGATITPRAVVNQVKRSVLAMLEIINNENK